MFDCLKLKSFLCTLVITLVVFYGELCAGSQASLHKGVVDAHIVCAKFSKDSPECSNGGCFDDCQGSPKPYCFSMWKNGTEGKVMIEMAGCWSTGDNCVNTSECIQSPSIHNVNFCCCSEEKCNLKVKNVFYPPTSSPASVTVTELNTEVKKLTRSHLMTTLICSIVPLVSVAAIIVVCFVLWKKYKRQAYRQQLPTVDPSRDQPPSPTPNRPLKLIELRARGRFGSVWKAQLHESYVAVKKFPLHDQQSWNTEQDIYRLPHMNHENILKFIGTERRADNLNIELWLITEFQQYGSLCEYLKGNTISWTEMRKMAESMMRGLSFLHDEVPAICGKGAKPAIAHRDFKSKNVLVKSDLTCCIADFGLALKFEPGKNPGETHGLVGTRRYMAPEVLEGAISFNRDAFLRIDMYACGMVLWELMSRCTAADGPVGEYQLPFEDEIGQHPTLEDMQELVVINKVRPAIKEHWLKHTGLEALASTIEECWDHDAEARLSADCVLERVAYAERSIYTSHVSSSNLTVTSQQQQPLIINTNQGAPLITPVVQTI